MQNVHATEENVYNEVATEEDINQIVPLVEEAPEEAVEQTVPLVGEAPEEAVEQTVLLVGEAPEEALPNEQAIEQKDEELTSETLAESGESEKVVEGAQGSNENVSSIVTEKDDTIRQNNVETIQSAAFNESLLEIENSENAINLTSGVSQADITAPNVIDVVMNQSDYESGETATGYLLVEEENLIEYVYISFLRQGVTGIETVYGDVSYREAIRNELGQYVVPFKIDTPTTLGTSSFTLESIRILDEARNETWPGIKEPLVHNVSFEVVNPEGGDITAPKVIDVVMNQSDYESGETATGYLLVEEENLIEYVYISFLRQGVT
ncbi:hypothetical protein HYO62_09980, partial [Aerococcaceae bacterium DSM 111022]|nr:hypothetical protein [Aerococcaceae bacterium DSM 111022]